MIFDQIKKFEDLKKFINGIEKLNEKIAIEIFLEKNIISIDSFYFSLDVLKNLNIEIKIYNDFLFPIQYESKIKLDKIIPKKIKLEFFNKWQETINYNQFKIYCLNLISGDVIKVVLHRIVFVENKLCLVCENVLNSSLELISTNEVENIILENQINNYKSKYGQFDINEFLNQLRDLNGIEERIVLKIYNQNNINLLPEYHYLRNSFVVTNSEGDLIWATNVEVCENIYNWLYSIKDSIEILDPISVKNEFSIYCELKKVS